VITPITKPRVWRRFLVYDLEWIPGKFSERGTMPVRMAGVYDKERGYRCYRTVEAFLENELTSKNRGKWFYAHAGGLADFQFLLEKLIAKRGYKIKASCSGSSLIIVHVSRGKNAWHFVDSYWLLRDKLRNIGKWVGISKGNEDESEEFYRDAPFETLREYNEVDCVILYRAIESFEEALWDLGGMLKMTVASCSMELFRRRFLSRPIETSSFGNHIARNAYFASRVEVFEKECHDSWYYDVNSSFPYAMTYKIPGEMTHHVHGRMPDNFDRIFISDVEIDVRDAHIPPIPTRLSGRLFFPVGSWRSWLTSVDIELLQRCGGRVTRVHETVAFESRDDLAEFATTLYDLRAKSDGFMKIACKYVMNSAYGKFAEGDEKRGIEIDPDNPGTKADGWEYLFPGCYIHTKKVPVPHEHVAISAHITAIGRRTLFDYMSDTSKVHYCDTDGFSTEDFLGPGEDKVLGALKLEKRIRHGEFVTQKVYRLDGDELDKGEWKPLGDKGVRAKGFSRLEYEGGKRVDGLAWKKFDEIMSGKYVTYRRMIRSRELLRRGQIEPREAEYPKHLSGEQISKRMFYPDGHSRPWHIDELLGILEKEK